VLIVDELRPERGQPLIQRAARRWLASPAVWVFVLGGLAVLSLVAMLPLSLLSRQLGSGLTALVIGVPCAGVGLLVARRQPGNPLGWLYLLIASCLFLATDGGDYSSFVYRHGHHLPFNAVGLALDQTWAEGIVLFVLAILLFPDGKLPSPLWRWALRAYCAVYAGFLVAYVVATAQALTAHPVRTDATGGLSAVDNPSGWFGVAEHSVLLLLLAFSVAFIGRQVLSWRRSSGERRQQLKWLACGAIITIVSVVVALPLSTAGTGPLKWLDSLLWFGIAALPVSMGVAILRYRLYEIDRIISRTLAYTAVTALLIGIYAGVVLLSHDVLPLTSPVAVAAATLVAAAPFSPLRRRVQRVVDRRFNRARYDAELTLADFAGRLKDAVDLDTVRLDLTVVVQQTLEPAHVSMWLGDLGHDRGPQR
jgi:hypothetical protein